VQGAENLLATSLFVFLDQKLLVVCLVQSFFEHSILFKEKLP